MSAFIGGEGTMDEPAVAVEEVSVFPGIQLSFRDYKGEKCCIRHHAEEGVMHIHHSKDGRMGWKMNDGMTYYLGPGDLLLLGFPAFPGSKYPGQWQWKAPDDSLTGNSFQILLCRI